MRTTTKQTLLVMLCVGMLTAVAMTTITSSVNQAYAKKKSCDESKTEDGSCQAKILENERHLRDDGDQSTTRSDHGENDSNIVDEQISEDQSEIQLQNSSITSTLPSIAPPEDSHFALPTM
jgi:type II secretory pathway pseudopilin PulG